MFASRLWTALILIGTFAAFVRLEAGVDKRKHAKNIHPKSQLITNCFSKAILLPRLRD